MEEIVVGLMAVGGEFVCQKTSLVFYNSFSYIV